MIKQECKLVVTGDEVKLEMYGVDFQGVEMLPDNRGVRHRTLVMSKRAFLGMQEAFATKVQAPKKAEKKEAPKKEAPKKEAPKKEAPKKEATKKEAPKKEAPKKEAP